MIPCFLVRWSLVITLLATIHAAAEPLIVKVTVHDIERRALVFPGQDAFTTPAPLVLAFHGFNSTYLTMASTRLHLAWPAATVVYPLGLTTMSKRYLREVPAWQAAPGRDDDRDVAYVDALLVELKKVVRVDERRIYATGMSNGALFCYVLLVERPRLFAGFACVAGAADFVADATLPRPILIIQGRMDTVVSTKAAERTRDLLRKLNGCGAMAWPWAFHYLSYHPCASGQPVIWRLHNGGHDWPGDATTMIVRFFQEQELKE